MASNDPRLDMAIQEADSVLAGDVSAQPFMKFIASAETDYGRHDDESALSYGPFQIDPIRYYDIAQNPERVQGRHKERLGEANKFLRKKFDDPEFDISKLGTYNPETQDYIPESRNLEYLRDPNVGAMLTRLALKQRPEDLPQGNEEMADYYMDFWGPKDQSPEKRGQALGNYNLYHPAAKTNQPVDDTMAGYNKVENAFTKP
jgi:hypothetical protein